METDTETKHFRDRYRDFFLRLNIFETDTETFFRDQNFRDRDRYSQKIEKSLDTEKSRDEMSHSAAYMERCPISPTTPRKRRNVTITGLGMIRWVFSKVFPLKEASRRSNCEQKQKQEYKSPERSEQSLAGYGTSLPT